MAVRAMLALLVLFPVCAFAGKTCTSAPEAVMRTAA